MLLRVKVRVQGDTGDVMVETVQVVSLSTMIISWTLSFRITTNLDHYGCLFGFVLALTFLIRSKSIELVSVSSFLVSYLMFQRAVLSCFEKRVTILGLNAMDTR